MLFRGPLSDLVSRNKQQQQKQQETTQKSRVNCKSKQMCFNLMVFQREIKTSPFGLSGESWECLPGSTCAFLARCLILKKNIFFPILLWLLWMFCVSHKAIHLKPSQEGVQTGIGTERGNFKLNTVTVYKIEALIERRNPREHTSLLQETFLGCSHT